MSMGSKFLLFGCNHLGKSSTFLACLLLCHRVPAPPIFVGGLNEMILVRQKAMALERLIYIRYYHKGTRPGSGCARTSPGTTQLRVHSSHLSLVLTWQHSSTNRLVDQSEYPLNTTLPKIWTGFWFILSSCRLGDYSLRENDLSPWTATKGKS